MRLGFFITLRWTFITLHCAGLLLRSVALRGCLRQSGNVFLTFFSRHLFLSAQARPGNVAGYYHSSRCAGLELPDSFNNVTHSAIRLTQRCFL